MTIHLLICGNKTQNYRFFYYYMIMKQKIPKIYLSKNGNNIVVIIHNNINNEFTFLHVLAILH